jgi:hypothetical protein
MILVYYFSGRVGFEEKQKKVSVVPHAFSTISKSDSDQRRENVATGVLLTHLTEYGNKYQEPGTGSGTGNGTTCTRYKVPSTTYHVPYTAVNYGVLSTDSGGSELHPFGQSAALPAF